MRSASPCPPAAIYHRRFRLSASFGSTLRLLWLIAGFAGISPLRGEPTADNPVPLTIELHPPFKTGYWALGQTEDGKLLVGAEYNIGIFDGLRWRQIPVPKSVPRSFANASGRVWVGATNEVGWIDPKSNDDTFHPAVRDLPGEVFQLKNAGPNLLAVCSGGVALVSGNGVLLDLQRFEEPSMRVLLPWRDGWIAVCPQEASFIRAGNHIERSNQLPIPADVLIKNRIYAMIPDRDRIFLAGARGSLWLDGDRLAPVEFPDWQDVRSESPITAFVWGDRPTLVRTTLNGGIEGFDPQTKTMLWRLRPAEDFDGAPKSAFCTSPLGVFFASEDHLYWLPSDTKARRLCTARSDANGANPAEHGFWISTSKGSWRVDETAWRPTNYSPMAAWSVKETPIGVVRGQINGFSVGEKRFWTDVSRGQVRDIAYRDGALLTNQVSRLGRWTPDGHLMSVVGSRDILISLCVEPTGDVIAGSFKSGLWRWHGDGELQQVRRRGDLRCVAQVLGDKLVVLWGDGLLEIGDRQLQLPAHGDDAWQTLAVSGRQIAVAGRAGTGTCLALVTPQAEGRWETRILEHKLLDEIARVESMAFAGDRIALAGSGGCIEVAVSLFDQAAPPAMPRIGFPQAASSGRGSRSLRAIVGDSSRLSLDASEDELRFVIEGGPEYWTQRVQFRYRITPGSAEWTGLDPTNEIALQRIGTGTHTLEIEGYSPLGSRTARFTIVRPPHWYFSGWAYATYALLIAGTGFGLALWRTRRLAQRARLLEQRVAERTAELHKANEAKSEFLASMSHEIRNPLNGVIGISGMLRESAESERDRRLTESLRACADQLRLVLDDVLDFSVIERGKVQLQLAPFPAGAAVRAAVLATDPKLERTQLTIAPGLAEKTFYGDEGKIRQIVSNLVSNAHRYGVPPEANVDVRFQDGRLTIAVSNTGPDISPEDRQRIFESFERGRSVAHRHVRGVGLGLTISRRFARAMGGDIHVTSENGVTCFTFSAPLTRATGSTPAVTELRRSPGGRILAVEDETYNRLVLGHVLNQLGYEVDWAENGTTAIDIFTAKRSYNFVFVDWMLPDIAGDELVRKLKTLGGDRTPPIVAVTAYATTERRTEALEVGATAFVTKPITRDKIEAVLTQHANPATARAPSDALDEPLCLGVLLDSEDPAARLSEFRRELADRLETIATGLKRHDVDAVACAAHRLASQLLAIHHHTLADELRALELAATERDWPGAEKRHVTVQALSAAVLTQLETVAATRR